MAYNCVLSSSNTSVAGLGGASSGSVLNGCWLTLNAGSASYQDILYNCVIEFTFRGDGANNSVLNNCTVMYNSFGTGYGIRNCFVTNSIVCSNIPSTTANYLISTPFTGGMSYCCTTPLPSSSFGSNNFTNCPIFWDGYHPRDNSPCIDAGNSSFAAGSFDYDGRTRTVNSMVDVGAFEYQGAIVESYISWLYQYRLPINGSADYADSDGDGLNNWQEWITGTVPTNATSVLKLSSPSNSLSGMIVTWQSVTNATYYLERSTNLTTQPPFFAIVSNLVGQTGSTSYTDTTATNGGPYFYRVGVQ
jgi:hypothetical protein